MPIAISTNTDVVLSSLGIGRGTPFAPDERTTAILEHAARAGRDQLLVSVFAGTREDIRAGPDRRWEWAGLIADNADFETPSGLDTLGGGAQRA